MAYSDNFPAVRPVFQADFANGGRIDPRATFSRASTANVFDGAKHLSSDNLLLQSSTYNVTWTGGAIADRNSGQTDPAGGTDGFEIVEASTNDFHRLSQTGTRLGGSNYAFTVYAKQNTGTRYLILTLLANINEYVGAVFDLAGGTPTTLNGSSATSWVKSATQTASGNGYYKCTLKLTDAIANATATIHLSNTTSPSLDGYGRYGYTGDGSSIDLAFASLSTTGATDYNATTTSIHRQYASSLVSKANNIGRFEVGTDGQSEGILIEGQAQNLLPSGATGYNSSNVFNWSRSNTSVTKNAAVAPTGSLEATLIYDNNAATTQHRFDTVVTATAAAHTFSGYFKTAGRDDIVVRVANDGNVYGAQFTFSTQTAANYGTAFSSLSISSVGNGWYRFVATTPTLASGSTNIFINLLNGSLNYTGDDYSGVLFYGLQFEPNAFASSVIATVDAAATRAADSLSCVLSDVGYTGGPVSVVAEFEAKASTTQYVGVLSNTGYGIYTSYANLYQDAADTVRIDVNGSGGASDARGDATVASSAGSRKIAARYENDNYGLCVDGGTVATDTSGTLPVFDKLDVGSYADGGSVNSTIKRIALYGSLSDTNLQAITS